MGARPWIFLAPRPGAVRGLLRLLRHDQSGAAEPGRLGADPGAAAEQSVAEELRLEEEVRMKELGPRELLQALRQIRRKREVESAQVVGELRRLGASRAAPGG